jgi:hypothetical protein
MPELAVVPSVEACVPALWHMISDSALASTAMLRDVMK